MTNHNPQLFLRFVQMCVDGGTPAVSGYITEYDIVDYYEFDIVDTMI